MRMARSVARILSMEDSMPMSLSPESTSAATYQSQASHWANSAARSASMNWMPWNSTMRRPDCLRSLM